MLTCAEGRVDQALAPGRIKTRRLGIRTGNLSVGDGTVGRFSGFKYASPGVVGKGWPELENRYLEQFRSKLSRIIDLDDVPR